MVADAGLTLLYDNIGIILGLGSAILGIIIKQAKNHGWNIAKIDLIAKYINESHDFITNNHDKFVGLVAAATDLSPELKAQLEASGADINKVVADSEQGKAALAKILNELNALTGTPPVAAKKK